MAPQMSPEESYNAALAELGDDDAANQLVTDPNADPAPVIDDPDAGGDDPDAGGDDPAKGGHPAWEEAWADVPDEIRDRQRPFFEKMDRDYQHLQAKHNPYKEFEENGVDPEVIRVALGIQNAILTDPADFYQQLGDRFGLSKAEVAQLKKDDPANLGDDDDDEYDDPRLKSLAQRVAAQEARELQAQQAQEQADQERAAELAQEQAQQQIESALGAIKAKHGEFDEEEVVLRAIANAQAGKNPSIENAYFELKAYEDRILQTRAKTAPKVLGQGSATYQPPAADPNKIPTADELLQRALAEGKRVAEGFSN